MATNEHNTTNICDQYYVIIIAQLRNRETIMENGISKRTLFKGGLALACMGAAAGLRPSDRGINHSQYFLDLGKALDKASISKPTVVIDKQLMLENINILKDHIKDRFKYRIIGKSLPSIPMLQLVMNESGTNRVMLFHQPFINQVAMDIPDSDILMGKPMPVEAAHNFYRELGNTTFDPTKQLQWLINSPERLVKYQDLASKLDVSMRINIEIDVGLHRGAVDNQADLIKMLEIIESDSLLSFSGFMGYEPHVVKTPGNAKKMHRKAMDVYQQRIDEAEAFYGAPLSPDLTLNAGGSPTYQLYNHGNFPCNELATGSCLVKPTDFDIDTLADHKVASFIATPVLKVMDQTEIPELDSLGNLISAWDPNKKKAFFTYNGYWKAIPESPAGLSVNSLFGRSTNQEMLNGSNSISLKEDDWVFLRPTQSEFVFLQFGDIAVMDNGAISELWPVFRGESHT